MRHTVAALFAVAIAVAGGARTSAQDPDAEARVLFQQGETAYTEGRFQEALELFRRAYDISQRPQLLYNIGLAATNVGNRDAALEALEQFIRLVPDAENRGVVEGRINALRTQIQQERDEAQRLSEAEARAREEAAARRRQEEAQEASATGGWILTIGGGVALVTGGVLFFLGMQDVATVEDAEDGTPWVELETAYDRAPLFTGIGLAAAGVGLAAGAIGLVLIATAGPGTEQEIALVPGGLALRGTF